MTADLPPVSIAARIDALEQHAIAVTEVLKVQGRVVPALSETLRELERITDVVKSHNA